jgi:hypothetical protein
LKTIFGLEAGWAGATNLSIRLGAGAGAEEGWGDGSGLEAGCG